MAVGYIAAAKELLQTYQPLMLVEITMSNGNVLRLASHMLAGTLDGGGGFPYGGHDYEPRLVNTDVSETQALSDQGIDFTPSVSVTIADPDGAIYNNWESGMGFKGATMVCRFLMWNVGINDFSTDSVVKFTGLCAQAEAPDAETCKITAVSKMNMVQAQLPSVHVQPTCGWGFPATIAQSQDAADNDDASCWECGYSPLATGGNQVGNLDTSGTCGALTFNATTLTFTGTAASQAVPFYAVINSGAGDQEVVNVLNVAGATWTIARGAQGSIGVLHSGTPAVSVPFASCDKTRQSCMKRLGNSATTSVAPDGDIAHDKSGRSTGRGNFVQYMPPGYVVSRGYLDGKWQQILNTSNQAKYGDIVPLNYGTTWVDGLVLNSNNDANYSRYEVLVGYGQHQWVYNVICNGERIPHTYNDSYMSQVPNELNASHDIKGGWWAAVNDGRRNGSPQAGLKGGDPYGSMCVLTVTVPIQVATGKDTPQFQIQVDGPSLRVYTDATTYTKVFTDNPSWVMLDVMFWAGLRAGVDIDCLSFVTGAAKYATQINYTTMSGGTSNTRPNDRNTGGAAIVYAKHAVSLSLRQRTSAADVLRGLRNNCHSLILPNMKNGLISLRPKETLASQQSSVFQLNSQNASNYNTAVASVKTDGTAGNGYLAYFFDESNIAKDRNGKSTFKILSRSVSDSPNVATVQFQNLENKYNQDSLQIADTEDLARVASQVITGNMQTYGTNSFDRTRRALAVWMAEQIRGNPRSSIRGETIGDTGGTVKIEFQTSFKGIHLSVGDIIGVTYQLRQISGWTFRITSIQPGMNARTIKIQAAYHNDGWYLDTYGQQNAPLYRHPQGLFTRKPYSWSAGYPFPSAGDSMYLSEALFQIVPEYSTAADNTAIAKVHIQGRCPVNNAKTSPQPPMVLQQATTASTGGTIPGGVTYYVAVAAKDVASSTYNPSYLSYTTAIVSVGSGTNTNTVTVNVPYWDLAALGYVVFAGTDPSRMCYQSDGNTTPATITLTSYKEGGVPPPDPLFDHFYVQCMLEDHSGVLDAQVLAVTATTIQLAVLNGGPLATNQFTGYDVSVFGLMNGGPLAAVPSQSPCPNWNARIASNTGDTLTLTNGLDGTTPNPTLVPRGDGTTGLLVDDWVTIRSKPTVGSDGTGNYIEDSAWVNNYPASYGPPISVICMTNANPGNIQTATNHGYSTGDKVYIQNMTGTSGFPLLVTVTVVDSTHFTIGVDTTSFGAYSGTGGFCQSIAQGLTVNALVGHIIWFISGPGRGIPVKIASNTKTRIYIDGAWPSATPTSNSRYIVCQPGFVFQTDSQQYTNSQFNQTVTAFTPTGADVDMAFDVSNYLRYGVVFMVQTADGAEDLSTPGLAPIRDTLIIGQQPAAAYTGSMAIAVDGVLSIGPDQGPVSLFNGATTLKAARLDVKLAPTGANLSVDIYAGAVLVMTLAIVAGTTSIAATAGQLISAPQIPAATNVKVNVTAVGTTYPGSDLTVSLFY